MEISPDTPGIKPVAYSYVRFSTVAQLKGDSLRRQVEACEEYCAKKGLEHNEESADGPRLELVPLPASAQFLNVIESVFSGMSRAIIHNSNYGTLDEAKDAIDRYFSSRNEHFRKKPKRAGDWIWGKERTPSTFSPSNNCKDPAYR